MRKLYSLFIFSLLLWSCSNDDLKAPIPAYITIEDISVRKPNSSVLASDAITDAKVFINDKVVGNFELPATIPIQNTGKVNLKIRGGIHNNGISNDRVDYPFYTTYEENITLTEEGKDTINPTLEYFPTVDFETPWSGEDFESGINFDENENSETSFIRESDPAEVFDGRFSGLAFLDNDQTFFEAWIPPFSDINRMNPNIYLELNYKCTHDFLISVYTNNQSFQNSIVFFKPNAVWTKVYVHLGPVFSTLGAASDFTLALGFKKNEGEEGRLWIDNVKIVRFDE